jgi:hypothetical protein
VLHALDFLAAAGLECGEGLGRGGMRAKGLEQRDRVFHGELGAGADGEMRGRFGVAEQHDIAHRGARVADHREAPPGGAVGDQLVAAEIFGEHTFEEAGRLRLGHLGEAGAIIALGAGFHHPGGAAWLVLVGVGDEHAERRLAERKCERVERAGRTHPGEAVRAQIDLRLEVRREGLPNP